MSRLSLHIKEWKDCKRCELHSLRKNIVLYKGTVPCDVFFCGEAPGKGEDVWGEPFVGCSGHLLDKIVKRALRWCGQENARVCFGNVIACIPKSEEEEGKLDKPPEEAIQACKPRLEDFCGIAKPKLIVCVGEDSKTLFDPTLKASVKVDRSIPRIHIHHPGWILRQNEVMQGIHCNSCVITIRDAIAKVLGRK